MSGKVVGNAHMIAGGVEHIPPLLALLEEEGIAYPNSADTYVREVARFGADDARSLQERASLRATGSGRRVFIVATPSLTTEAQNVLLKTLEEPPAGALFFFIVPAPAALLPTLRSRMQLLGLAAQAQDSVVDVDAFLRASLETRLALLKPLLEKDDDDKRDLRPSIAFLSALESRLSAERKGLRAVYRARRYLTDKGALVKPLLEQVALLVPKV